MIEEGLRGMKMTPLNCHRFNSSQLRLRLSVLAYNLRNLRTGLVLPAWIDR